MLDASDECDVESHAVRCCDICCAGSAAAATLGSAPAPAAGGSGGDGLSRTVVIIIAVVASVAGVAIITLAIVLGKWLAGRNEEDLADQETSVAMSGGSGRVSDEESSFQWCGRNLIHIAGTPSIWTASCPCLNHLLAFSLRPATVINVMALLIISIRTC